MPSLPEPVASPGWGDTALAWEKQLREAAARVSQRFQLASADMFSISARRPNRWIEGVRELQFSHWVCPDDISVGERDLQVMVHSDLRSESDAGLELDDQVRVHLHHLLLLTPVEGGCELTPIEAIAVEDVLAPWMALPYVRQGVWDVCTRIGITSPNIAPMTIGAFVSGTAFSRATNGESPPEEEV